MADPNLIFPIYNSDGTPFFGLKLNKSTYTSVVMSLDDKIEGDIYYASNNLVFTFKEYVVYNGVRYSLRIDDPPTILKKGMTSDNSELKGMTKYSLTFYHPMSLLYNLPFTDIAVSDDEKKYKSEDTTFYWKGTLSDLVVKINKNIFSSTWLCLRQHSYIEDGTQCEVSQFSNQTISDALKFGYDSFKVPYVVDDSPKRVWNNNSLGGAVGYTEQVYDETGEVTLPAIGDSFYPFDINLEVGIITDIVSGNIVVGGVTYIGGNVFPHSIVFGTPANEILIEGTSTPFVFKFGQGLGLKNNDRTPRKNTVITRIAGYGSETNIPFGYPKIQWTGNQSWTYTVNNSSAEPNSYPIIDGTIDGVNVKLINHPYTRKVLMPTVYVDSVNKKVNPNAVGYDADTVIVDYYDAISDIDRTYPTPINPLSPSYLKHEFDVKPTIKDATYEGQAIDVIKSISWINDDGTAAADIDDTYDTNSGKYKQQYLKIEFYPLGFDLYAMAALTSAMSVNMQDGACRGCTFEINADWDVVKNNFYVDGVFTPSGAGSPRDYRLFKDSTNESISVIVKKDTNTYGTLMPNIYQKPIAGDKFVFLGIDMPQIYISDKQSVLDDLMKDYMLENNVPYYDYPLDFDEHYLTENQHILSQIKTNCIIRSEYAGQNIVLYVKDYSISWGDSPLPTYKISLTDNIEVVTNAIGQVVDGLNKLETQTKSAVQGATSGSFSRNVSIAGILEVLGKTTLHALEATSGEFTGDIHTTKRVIGDEGVFAGGIGDLGEYGTAGYNSFTITGSGNAITNVIHNVSSLTFVRGATFSLDGHTHLSTDITNLSTDVIPEGTAKFIYYPELPLGRFKRDDGSWADVTAGGGSSAANVYLTNNNSDISGYKTASSINDAATSTFTYTQTGVGEHLLATFLYGTAIGITTIDAGSWSLNHYSKASTTAGNPYLRFEIFKRSTAGVETTLFTKSSFTLTTDYVERTTTDWQPSFPILATDRIGVKIYVVSGVAASVTFSLQVGDSTVSYLNTPLALRHTQLRGLNDDTGFLHITSTEKSHYETAYSHTSLTDNPHDVDKAQVGLGNVDNTSDINKPVSTAQQTVIDTKLDATQSGSIICNSIPVAPEAAYEVSNITFSSAASVTRCHYVIKFVHKIPTGVEAGYVTLKIGTFINNVYYRGSAASSTNSWDDDEWCDCFYDNGLWRCAPTEATMSYQVWDSAKEIIKDNRIL